MMHRQIRLGILLFVLILGAVLLAGCAKSPVIELDGEDFTRTRTLTVQGTGSVMVEPDIARITMGVMTSDADAQTAQDQNDGLMTAVIAAIRGAGVTEKDIQTTQYNVYPRYNYDKDTPEITGFEVTHMVTVVVRDIETVGQVIKAANRAGANQSQSISFCVDDQDAAYQQALAEAIENAKAKAQIMATSASVSLKAPAAVYEGSVSTEYGVSRAYTEGALYDTASVPTQSGQLEIQAQVTIVYGME